MNFFTTEILNNNFYPLGGRGGGGGGGKNKHMGELPAILSLLRGTGMSDADILNVIAPPASLRDRSANINKSEGRYYQPNGVYIPGHANYRGVVRIGNTTNVCTNHFRIDLNRIPTSIHHYHIHIYKYDRENKVVESDIAPSEDSRITMELVHTLKKNHREWHTDSNRNQVGITYDGRSALFATNVFTLPERNSENQPILKEDVALMNAEGENSRKKYRVTVTYLGPIFTPAGDGTQWRFCDANVIRALDSCLLSFARWQQIEDDPQWFLVGSKAFRATGDSFRLLAGYLAMRGYYASLKACLAGLVLVCDMSVTAFLVGGKMIDLMVEVGGYRSIDEMVNEANRSGLNKRALTQLNEAFKNSKCKITHLGHSKKMKCFGPPANSRESAFPYEGKQITVADYFAVMAKTKDQYKRALAGNGGRLRYPTLPTVNIGTATHPVLVPAELILVPGGQCRSNKVTGDMTAQLIRYAAVRPEERMQYVLNGSQSGSSLVHHMRNDATTGSFGLNSITLEPMRCPAILLPPAKLSYGNNRNVDPQLSGGWRMEGLRFSHPAQGNLKYGIVVVMDRAPQGLEQAVEEFMHQVENDSKGAGVNLTRGGPPMISNDSPESLKDKFGRMKNGGASIVMVVLVVDAYCVVKLVADKLGLATQCLKWKNIDRSPKGYHLNVMLKINTKLGGTNHTLISRTTPGRPVAPTFQDPPQSLSWLFDKPCMLMGIDVSHAEPGSDRESMAAVVASMDGKASQYACHISAQPARLEIVSALEEAVQSLLLNFKARNNAMPATIIVFRDGVGDGQFEQVVQRELPAIKGALALMGYDDTSVKVCMVVCQKGHHTRLVYEEQQGPDKAFINPCPGLVIDATGAANSITSGRYNEFYLNSHAAIQGTAKPCKYALVYDEIGIQMAELELLTYWSCYLYCRCNKSVSLATPAYYAHWASKRAKNLYAGGGNSEDLQAISSKWIERAARSNMFFV